MSLNDIWYALFVVVIAGYVILDGFDIGVGILHLFVAHTDEERRTTLNSIGPIWDGNEVWLVVGGGVLFAAFPIVYAALFSGFYGAMMLILLFLILRTVAIEFRSQRESAGWRRSWDVVFGVASFALAMLLGVAFGNVITGVPITQSGDVQITGVLELLKPFPIVIGLTAIAMLALHGALYLQVKTEDPIHRRAHRAIPALMVVFGLLGVLAVVMMLVKHYGVVDVYERDIWPVLVPLAAGAAFVMIRAYSDRGRDGAAFLSSSVMLAVLLISGGIGIYPNLLTSTIDPAYDMTVTNAASSSTSLTVMLVVAIIGLPFVLLYTAGVQYLFRGKVRLSPDSY